jgi:hypothetical protein
MKPGDNWDKLPNGHVRLAQLLSFQSAVDAPVVFLRVEYLECTDFEKRTLEERTVQLVMPPELAKLLSMELAEAADAAKPPSREEAQ